MEDTLRVLEEGSLFFLPGLNPCFNGRYSQRTQTAWLVRRSTVLILVLMEDTLRGVHAVK